MNERVRPTRSGLLLVELLTAAGMFVFCAAICIGLFLSSERISRSDNDMVQASLMARDVSESYKAAHGDLSRVMGVAGGSISENGLLIYYDREWRQTSEEGAVFLLTLSPHEKEGYKLSELIVSQIGEETPLITLEVAALEEGKG